MRKLALVCLSSAGVGVSLLLQLTAPLGQIPCAGGNGCEMVAASPLGQALPLPALGIAYYSLVLALVNFGSPGWNAGRILVWLSMAGCAVSLTLTSYALAVVGATCIWCLLSALLCCLIASLSCMPDSSPFAFDRGCRLASAGTLALFAGVPIALSCSGYWAIYNGQALARTARAELVAPGRPTLGAANSASATVVVFADLDCPSGRELVEHLLAWQGAAPSRCVVLRHAPNDKHLLSRDYGVFVEAAAARNHLIGFLQRVTSEGASSSLKMESQLNQACGRERAISPAEKERAEANIEQDIALLRRLRVKGAPFAVLLRPGADSEYLSPSALQRLPLGID